MDSKLNHLTIVSDRVDTPGFTKIWTLVALAMFGAACSKADNLGRADVSVKALSTSNVFSINVAVTGNEVATPIVASLNNRNGQWGTTVEHIPVGSNRSFSAHAFDALRNKIFSGSASGVTILAGTTAHVVIYLQEETSFPTLVNHAPIIDSVAASSLSVAPGKQVFLGVTAHDPDPADTVVTTWNAACGVLDGATTTHPVWTAPSSEQTCRIEVTVTDPHAAHTSAGLVIAVRIDDSSGSNIVAVFNGAPIVSNMSADPYSLLPGSSTTLTVEATDADLDPLSYSWRVIEAECNGTFGDPTAETTTFALVSDSIATACTFAVTVAGGLVSDHRGDTNFGELTIPVGPSPTPTNTGEPVIIGLAQSSDTANAGEVISLIVTAQHTGIPPLQLSYTWTASSGSLSQQTDIPDEQLSKILWTAPTPAEVGATVEVLVSDSNGATASYVFDFR
jgi:hypothetical protein